MHHYRPHQPQRVYKQVALAALDLLPRVTAAGPPFFCCLHRLAIDNRCGRSRLFASFFANLPSQVAVDGFQCAIISPAAHVVVYRGPRNPKVMRQIPPGTTRAQHVNKRVEDLPYVYPTRSAPGLGWRDQPPHDLPLGLSQISRIGLAFHAYQFTSSSPFGMIHFSYTLLEPSAF